MRLLKYNDAGEFSLAEFTGNDIPSYAIFSHTWRADGDEVTYKDMIKNTGRDKAGYAKVKFCGEQALKDDIHYFWIDTCCINKSDTAELSEAINSMFIWYRRAAVCYVYLSDVSADYSAKRLRDSQQPWELGFRKSRWFTRGWTLQELIAPISVVFFSLEYEQLGDKRTLEEHIHQRTGIDAEALQGRPLSHFTIAERMSWAKKRETKREEDEAYCLLGILEINLGPLYGEGKKNAFARLDDEIKKLSKNKPLTLSPNLRNLPYAIEAPFDSDSKQQQPSCLDGTHVDVLRDIYNWADGQDERCIFWLSGLAGTGKSTIARTIANEYYEKGRLGASFFFSKGGGDVSNTGVFFTSIAAQLATKIPLLQSHIENAIGEHNDISRRSLRDQWRRLIFGPLSRIDGDSSPFSYLLVIDALDECDDENSIRIILQLLVEARSLSKVRLRVFLTSRPEVPVSQSVHRIGEARETLISHQLLPAYRDIPGLLEYKLTRIRWESDDLPSDWPGEENFTRLIRTASGLFIIAITICGFIQEGGKSAAARLSIILGDDFAVDDLSTNNDYTKEAPKVTSIIEQEDQLNKIYTAILGYSVSQYKGEEGEEWYTQLRRIAGAIILLFSPLSTFSMARLLHFSGEEFTRTINTLRSFINVPQGHIRPIRLHHPSFRDFLLSQHRCKDPRFWVDEKSAHQNLAESCIQLMRTSLRQDICAVGTPGALVVDIHRYQLERCLPLEVQYACLYWVKHLQMSGLQLRDNDQVHKFVQEHLLHWLEALSWMQKIPDGILAITSLEAIALAGDCHGLYALIYDVKRFTLYSRIAIEQAPLQIYYSALIFAPTTSVIRHQFQRNIPTWVKTLPCVSPNWSALLQALEGHSDRISNIVFSPDGKVLASTSWDATVRLWDTGSGVELLTLEANVNKVTFSPDGKVLASTSWDGTVRLWDTGSGVELSRPTGDPSKYHAIAFSPDGKVLAIGGNEMVLLWDINLGAELSRLKGDWAMVTFSPDVKVFVSAAHNDGTVRLWDTISGAELLRLKDDLDRFKFITFSPDGKLLGTAGYSNRSVRIWDTSSGAELLRLKGDWAMVTFSPDIKVFVSAAHNDGTVRLWDTISGAELLRLKDDPDGFETITFSPDGKLLATAGYPNRRVRIWDTSSGAELLWLDINESPPYSFAFSPDGKVLALAGGDHRIMRLYHISLGAELFRLDDNLDPLKDMTLSPDGKLLASISGKNIVKLWDTGSGLELSRPTGDVSVFHTIAFSPDGKVLALGGYGRVLLWDISLGTELLGLRSYLGTDLDVAFSRDSKVLVSKTNRDIRLWDTGSGAELLRLEDKSNYVNAIALSPNGNILASLLLEETVRFWSTRSRAFLSTTEIKTFLTKLSFASHGSHLGADKALLDLTSFPSADGLILDLGRYDPPSMSSKRTFMQEQWLVRGTEKLLWFPPDHRPTCVATHGRIVALGYASGSVSFLELPRE